MHHWILVNLHIFIRRLITIYAREFETVSVSSAGNRNHKNRFMLLPLGEGSFKKVFDPRQYDNHGESRS
jgi:hypothetical protein